MAHQALDVDRISDVDSGSIRNLSKIPLLRVDIGPALMIVNLIVSRMISVFTAVSFAALLFTRRV